MSDSPLDNNIQKILENAQIGGDLEIGDIQQIINANNIVNSNQTHTVVVLIIW